jgi:hypothetical protein
MFYFFSLATVITLVGHMLSFLNYPTIHTNKICRRIKSYVAEKTLMCRYPSVREMGQYVRWMSECQVLSNCS